MARTSYVGYLRQYGSTKNATPAVLMVGIQVPFDPTQASAGTGKILPKGAIVMAVQSFGGATGGTNPTVDMGTAGDPDGWTNELDADVPNASGFSNNGILQGTVLTVDTEIFAGVGGSAATGGTVETVVYYIMEDDGKA